MTILMSLLLAAAQAAENRYLEVPVVGRFGESVTAAGVEDALEAAAALGARHVVFTVDSAGGDPLVARDLHHALARHARTFRYHAVVREATGLALAVVVACDTVFIRPCGRIGGVELPVDESVLPGVSPEVIRYNLALMAGDEARRHGRSADLVRAMIDPSEPVTAWKDVEGRVLTARGTPSGVPQERILLEHPAGKVLTLDDREAVDLGFAVAWDGDLDGLGGPLGLGGWTSLGSAGREMMEDAAVMERIRQEALRSDRHRFLVHLNRARREAVKASIERFLNLADEWHPSRGSYSTVPDRTDLWDRLWEGCPSDSGRLTAESRRRWRERTDTTAAALSKARGGVLEMMALEKEARRLGEEPLYPEGRLEGMRLDLELRIAVLVRERDRRFKEER